MIFVFEFVFEFSFVFVFDSEVRGFEIPQRQSSVRLRLFTNAKQSISQVLFTNVNGQLHVQPVCTLHIRTCAICHVFSLVFSSNLLIVFNGEKSIFQVLFTNANGQLHSLSALCTSECNLSSVFV